MRELWRSRGMRRFRRDRLAMAGLAVIALYALIAVGVRLGALQALGASFDTPIVTEEQEVAFYTTPSGQSWQHWLGTDRQGRSILVRALASIDVAMSVGLVTGLIAVGTAMALAAARSPRPMGGPP